MAEIPKGLRDYLGRELVYLIGGGSVVSTFLYYFDRLPDGETPIAFYALAAGIGYVIAYALQDCAGILRLTTTTLVAKPVPPLRVPRPPRRRR